MKFPAKLLLFGEHTVNLGSQALAIPLLRFGGSFIFLPQENRDELKERQMDLPEFADFLIQLRAQGNLPTSFQAEKFKTDLAAGLVFESDIPRGYGAGSSGALVAAIFHRYGKRGGEGLGGLKQLFARMESYFHGTSSGTDPLVCFLQQPVVLSKTTVTESNFSSLTGQFFLVDTGIQRQATPFIEYFLAQNESAAFREKCSTMLLPAVEKGM